MKSGAHKKKIVFAAVGLCVAILAAVAFWPGEKEPEYQGKKLSEWLQVCAKGGTQDELKQAEEAVRQIGTNGLPLLVKWIQHEPWAERKGVKRIMQWLPQPVANSSAVQRLLVKGVDRNNIGLVGFNLLREQASPAKGELAGLVKHPVFVVAARAIVAMTCIGEPAYPALAAIVTNQVSAQLKGFTITMMARSKNLGSNTIPAITLFVQSLNDTNADVFVCAAAAIREFPEHADITIPGLVKCLANPDKEVRFAGLHTLGYFGQRAKTAADALAAQLDDPDPKIRKWTTNALLRIAPEMLGTNGVSAKHE